MAWDLRGALLRKQEVETARLVDFAFRERARTMRLLAERLGRDPRDLVRRIALYGDEAILAALAEEGVAAAEALADAYDASRAEARRQLIAERGDPAPHRLA